MDTVGSGALQLSKPSGRELRVERVLLAPRELVWRAHTEPALLARWWARGNTVEVETHELHVGGHWRFVEREGDAAHGFEGRFRELRAPERLAQTFDWDGTPGHPCVQTIELHELPARRTRVVTTSLFFTVQERDALLGTGAEAGIADSYAALDQLLLELEAEAPPPAS